MRAQMVYDHKVEVDHVEISCTKFESWNNSIGPLKTSGVPSWINNLTDVLYNS